MFTMRMSYHESKRILVRRISFPLHKKSESFGFDHSDEYATYIRLIDEILEQRYNYVIQSRRTIETFPVRDFSFAFSFLQLRSV